MKITTVFLALASLLQGGAAVYWQQYYYGDCTGTVENDGTEITSTICVPQQGASVYFSNNEGCVITFYGDNACTEDAYYPDAACQPFDGTGGSFLIDCGV